MAKVTVVVDHPGKKERRRYFEYTNYKQAETFVVSITKATTFDLFRLKSHRAPIVSKNGEVIITALVSGTREEVMNEDSD
jgi:hypothetical protein